MCTADGCAALLPERCWPPPISNTPEANKKPYLTTRQQEAWQQQAMRTQRRGDGLTPTSLSLTSIIEDLIVIFRQRRMNRDKNTKLGAGRQDFFNWLFSGAAEQAIKTTLACCHLITLTWWFILPTRSSISIHLESCFVATWWVQVLTSSVHLIAISGCFTYWKSQLEVNGKNTHTDTWFVLH